MSEPRAELGDDITSKDVSGEIHHAADSNAAISAVNVEHLQRVLGRLTFHYRDERDLQIAIYGALAALGMESEREVSLSPGDRIDFYLPFFKVGIEVKVGGNADALRRQITRYAQHVAIEAILVVTNRAKHAAEIPASINGKPIRVVRTKWL